jgi:FADH2-dependent halogenase
VNLDAIIIGGGPGGSTAAAVLAGAGRRVVLLEKERFPRFHIGESLLPYNRPLFVELGLGPALQAADFPRKTGAQFLLANGAKARRFVFRHGRFTRESETIQVERARFDELLLRHAQSRGADVREGWTAGRVTAGPDRVAVEATDPAGRPDRFEAPFVLDASGRANLTGNQQGLRVVHPRHRKLAVFGHFDAVWRDPGEAGGDTVIVRFADRWVWLIPISATRTSVGLVLDPQAFAAEGGDAATVFWAAVRHSPVLRARLDGARLAGALQVTSDFSYFNRRLVGPRLLRVGDAAGFMDPIFSAGVYLAMWSGRLAARAVLAALAAGTDGRRPLAAYERRLRRAMRVYWRLVEHYYTTPFMELFLEPRHGLDLPAAVLAVLAGDFEPAWPVRWRLEFFYLLVRLQRFHALVPRLDFALPAPAPA